jgi:hypothetical protein
MHLGCSQVFGAYCVVYYAGLVARVRIQLTYDCNRPFLSLPEALPDALLAPYARPTSYLMPYELPHLANQGSGEDISDDIFLLERCWNKEPENES